MPGACTKRSRNHDDDPQLSPDESSSPSKRSHTRKPPVNHEEDDDDDETSTDPSSTSDSSIDSSDDDGDDDDEQQEQQGQEQQEQEAQEQDIPSIQSRKKPRIKPIPKNNDIFSRITAFLPQIKTANEHLERELAAGRGKEMQLDEAGEEDEGRYIEMNLGLGVLEEKRPGDEDYDPSSSDDDDDNDEEQEQQNSTTTELPNRPKDSRVLGKLMGEKKGEAKKPTIEEMNE